jgi:hypothetical protein
MRYAIRGLILCAALLLAGCAEPPTFSATKPGLPPLAAGTTRLYVYRALELYETNAPTTTFLNGKAVAVAWPGAVLYRDVAPGTYLVSVHSDGRFPDQFKTVTFAPGDTIYVRVDSLHSWECNGVIFPSCSLDTFAVREIRPETAQAEMQQLHFIND